MSDQVVGLPKLPKGFYWKVDLGGNTLDNVVTSELKVVVELCYRQSSTTYTYAQSIVIGNTVRPIDHVDNESDFGLLVVQAAKDVLHSNQPQVNRIVGRKQVSQWIDNLLTDCDQEPKPEPRQGDIVMTDRRHRGAQYGETGEWKWVRI